MRRQSKSGVRMIWKQMSTAPRDGTQILVRRYNGCSYEYAVVWWRPLSSTGDGDRYPWASDHDRYSADRFDNWVPIQDHDTAIDEVLTFVGDELHEATKKFGSFKSAHEGYAVIKEELDELWDDIKANHGYAMCAAVEAKQVAAMACRYIMDVTWRKHGDK